MSEEFRGTEAAARVVGRDRTLSRRLELPLVALGVPALAGATVNPGWWIPLLWLTALVAMWRTFRDRLLVPENFWRPIALRSCRSTVRRMVRRFALSALVLVGAVCWLVPERLFDLPRQHPWKWAAILVLYPVLSVYAQEVVYRRYFFTRARAWLVSEGFVVAGSALAFAAMHLVFGNLWAVALTLVGGYFFADTYRRTGSLRLVCVEHALYGNLIFTIGLGDYFCHANVGV